MSFWSRLFGRETPVEDRRCMNEDWRVGDLAECIGDGPWDCGDTKPELGDICRVSAVVDAVGTRTNTRNYYLGFVGLHNRFCCTSFRKILPLHTAADAEFTALIKRPVRKPVKA